MVFIFRIFIVLNNKNKYSEKEKQEKLEERQVKLRKIFIRRYVEVQGLGYRDLNKLLVDPDRLLKNVLKGENYFICPIQNQTVS